MPQVAAQIDTQKFDFSASVLYKVLQVEGQDPHHRTFGAEPTSMFGNTGPSLSNIVDQLTAIEYAINLLAQELRIAFTTQSLESALNFLSPTSATLRSFAVFQREANSNRPPVTVDGNTPTLGYRGNWQANTGDALTAQFFLIDWLIFPQRMGAPWDDFMEWKLASRAQMQAIENLAGILGNGDPKAGLQRLGFFTDAANVPDYFHFEGARGSSSEIPPYGLLVSREVYVLGPPAPPSWSIVNACHKIIVRLRFSCAGAFQVRHRLKPTLSWLRVRL